MQRADDIEEAMARMAARLAALEAQNDALAAENARLAGDLRQAAAGLAEARAQIDRLVEQIKLANQRYWAPRSEKVSPGQLSLFNDAEASAAGEAPETPAAGGAPRRRGGKRKVDWSSLETVVVDHELPEGERSCPCCGGALEEMGSDTVRRLRMVPARVVCEEHRTRRYRCPSCCAANAAGEERAAVIVRAPSPAAPIPGSPATPSLIAHLVHGKYVMAQPLYRMERELAALGAPVGRQSMSNWLLAASERWLSKVAGRIWARILSRDVIHADETTVQVLREPDRAPASKSYMWVFRTAAADGPPAVRYVYRPTRSGEVPRRLLGGWGGYLCTDGYAPYFSINDGRAPGEPRVVNVACLVHVRRRFAEIVRSAGGDAACEAAGSVALEGRRRIDAIFRADARLAQEPPEARREARMRDVAPLMRSFGEWASAREAEASPGLALHGALRYALRCWPYVGNALLDGRLALDNNIAERAVKPFVIGRKNWLFSDTPRGASASATIYSVVETARANGLEPRAYVEWLLEEMPAAGELNDGVLDGFLPWAAGVPARLRAPAARARELGESAAEPVLDIDPDTLATNRD